MTRLRHNDILYRRSVRSGGGGAALQNATLQQAQVVGQSRVRRLGRGQSGRPGPRDAGSESSVAAVLDAEAGRAIGIRAAGASHAVAAEQLTVEIRGAVVVGRASHRLAVGVRGAALPGAALGVGRTARD